MTPPVEPRAERLRQIDKELTVLLSRQSWLSEELSMVEESLDELRAEREEIERAK